MKKKSTPRLLDSARLEIQSTFFMTKQSTLLINKNTVFGNQQKCLILKFQPPSFEIMDLYKEKTDLVIVCCVMGYDRSAFTASEVTRDRNLKKVWFCKSGLRPPSL